MLCGVRLIAEPWDVGGGGYQLGRFPPGWSEWNDKFRDTTREFWRGSKGYVAEMGYRLSGSSDQFQGSGRGPSASVNYVTAHDGFTLTDLVSYDRKHNLANGEGNRDGTDNNRSWNCGVEGLTNDADILDLRDRQRRNFLATLLFSQACRCCSAATSWGAGNAGTTTPTARTTKLVGTTGSWRHGGRISLRSRNTS